MLVLPHVTSFRVWKHCAPMNVIVILCDTLRRDHVGAYTGGKPLTGLLFEAPAEMPEGEQRVYTYFVAQGGLIT